MSRRSTRSSATRITNTIASIAANDLVSDDEFPWDPMQSDPDFTLVPSDPPTADTHAMLNDDRKNQHDDAEEDDDEDEEQEEFFDPDVHSHDEEEDETSGDDDDTPEVKKRKRSEPPLEDDDEVEELPAKKRVRGAGKKKAIDVETRELNYTISIFSPSDMKKGKTARAPDAEATIKVEPKASRVVIEKENEEFDSDEDEPKKKGKGKKRKTQVRVY
ncbi:hypothetical protein DFH09DRAFT_1090602 [Mycena vulgaris]|nr:hypothetical protein DFH09DRAFT_1090602 [Mycena vulgaris]